jgi:hypothetical protein
MTRNNAPILLTAQGKAQLMTLCGELEDAAADPNGGRAVAEVAGDLLRKLNTELRNGKPAR